MWRLAIAGISLPSVADRPSTRGKTIDTFGALRLLAFRAA